MQPARHVCSCGGSATDDLHAEKGRTMRAERLESRTLLAAEAATGESLFSREDLVGAYEGLIIQRKSRGDFDALVTAHTGDMVTARVRIAGEVYDAVGTTTAKGKLRLAGNVNDSTQPGSFSFSGTVAKNGVDLKGRFLFRQGVLLARGKLVLARTSAEPRIAEPAVHLSAVFPINIADPGNFGWISDAP